METSRLHKTSLKPGHKNLFWCSFQDLLSSTYGKTGNFPNNFFLSNFVVLKDQNVGKTTVKKLALKIILKLLVIKKYQ